MAYNLETHKDLVPATLILLRILVVHTKNMYTAGAQPQIADERRALRWGQEARQSERNTGARDDFRGKKLPSGVELRWQIGAATILPDALTLPHRNILSSFLIFYLSHSLYAKSRVSNAKWGDVNTQTKDSILRECRWKRGLWSRGTLPIHQPIGNFFCFSFPSPTQSNPLSFFPLWQH